MRRSACLLATAAAAVLGLIARVPARAQTGSQPPEVIALFEDIADIDKLRVISPLKLDADQVGRMIQVLRSALDDYNKKLADIAVPPIRGIAADIKETRRKALSGGTVPKDFDQKVKDLEADALKRRKAQDDATLRAVADAFRKILTPDQIKAGTNLAKKLTADKNGEPTLEGKDAQFFNLYVRETFLVYPRIVPLLQDMKQALGGGQATSGQ